MSSQIFEKLHATTILSRFLLHPVLARASGVKVSLRFASKGILRCRRNMTSVGCPSCAPHLRGTSALQKRLLARAMIKRRPMVKPAISCYVMLLCHSAINPSPSTFSFFSFLRLTSVLILLGTPSEMKRGVPIGKPWIGQRLGCGKNGRTQRLAASHQTGKTAATR